MTRKLVTVAISLVISFALWMYVVMVIGPEYSDTFRNVEVKLVNESALEKNNLMILGDKEFDVDLEITGNRSALNKLNSSNITVELDLSTILEPNKTTYRYEVYLPDSVTLKGQSPARIPLEIVRRKVKTVDVEVVFDEDKIPAGYGTLPVEQELEKIEIAGPEDVIDQIMQAKIELDITDENNKSDYKAELKAALCDANGQEVDSRYVTVMTAEAETIAVKLPIRMKKEIPLKLHVIEGGGLTAESITLDPPVITVLGSEEALRDLNEWYLNTEEDPLDLTALTDGEEIPPFSLEGLNNLEDIVNKSGVTEVHASVSFETLTQREFVIKQEQIQLFNIPEGTLPDISERQIKVIVRGETEVVNRLTADDIFVSVDFSDAKIGQMKEWPVKITINGDPVEAGVIGGPYTVYVEIKDAAQVAQLSLLTEV